MLVPPPSRQSSFLSHGVNLQVVSEAEENVSSDTACFAGGKDLVLL